VSNKKATKPKPDTSCRVFQRDKLNPPVSVRSYPLTEKQKNFLELATHKDTKIIFLSGPAGSSKSFISVLVALELLNNKKVAECFYCRPIIESADSGARLGFLPGEYANKVAPYEEVLISKLQELLNKGDIDRLMKKEQRIKTLTVNFLRGASLRSTMGIIDEAQNFTLKECKTILTRIGEFSKFIICADVTQSDLPDSKQGGFQKLFDHFKIDNPKFKEIGIHCIEFTKEDILRSELCAFLVEELTCIH